MSWTQRSKIFSMYTKGLFLSNIVHKSVLVSTSPLPDNPSTSQVWHIKMLIRQHDYCTGVCLRLASGHKKGHSKMCSFITQHNATDVASFEGACNWHSDCRDVHQSCCLLIECLFLYHKPSPKEFQRIWQYIQLASQPQTTCNHTSPGSTSSFFTFKIVWDQPPGQLLQQSVCITK